MIENGVNLIIEYIEQFLSDSDIIHGKISIDTVEIDEVKYKTLEIALKNKTFERHINLGIKLQDEGVFFKKLLNTFIEKYADSENIGISKYYVKRCDPFNPDFHGIEVYNTKGSQLEFYFCPSNEESRLAIQEYNQKLDDFIQKSRHK